MNCNDLKTLFMDFLYDEISDTDRDLFLTHLSQCQSCQQELAALKKTSNIIQQWENVDPDFNVVVVTDKVSWHHYLKDRLAHLIPKPRKIAYGIIFATAIIFLLLAAANTEITYRQGEFKMNLGLFSRPATQQSADKLLASEFIEQLQKQNYYFTNSLIQQSEERQRKELASAILQIRQDFERKRIEDLNLVGFGLDKIEQNTFRELKRTDNSLNELIRYISEQKRR